MDCQDYNTVGAEHKKGQHLGMAERGTIKALKCGNAELHHLFEPSQMVCSRTLYMAWNGYLSIYPTELPEALKRKTKKRRMR